jgi:integrase
MAKRRRGQGEGTISQRRDGRWWARLDLGWADGKRKRQAYYGRTYKEALDQLKKAQTDRELGVLATGRRQTVALFLTRWLEDSAKHTLRQRTLVRYEQLIRIHALPFIGNIQLAKLTPQHLAQLYASRLEASQSARSVEFLHAVLHRALKQALKWGLIARNPADAVDAPKPERKDIRPLDLEQANALLRAAQGDPLEAFYVLAVTTGMRLGELLALRWADLDLDTARLQVRHTLQRTPGAWSLAEPKTERSRRSIKLSAAAVAALREHRKRQVEVRLAAAAWHDHNFVFCQDKGEPLDGRNLYRTSLYPLLRRAGLGRMRFHDLRHTAATLLLAQGVHPKKVQDLLGHSTIALTLDTYSHVLPNLQDEIAERMDGLFQRPRKQDVGSL